MKSILIILLLCSYCCTAQNVEQKFISVKGTRIFYQVEGKGPALLLLHGALLDHSMWREQVAFFKQYFKVITIDLPGHGQTLNGIQPLSTADFLLPLLDTMNIDKASFLGLSLGAICVTDFMIDHHERIQKVILSSPGLLGSQKYLNADTAFTRYTVAYNKAMQQKDTTGCARQFANNWLVGPVRNQSQVSPNIWSEIYSTVLLSIRSQSTWFPLFVNFDAAEKISKVDVPVLVMIGEKDFLFIKESAALIEKKIKGAISYEMKNVAHLLNLENPVLFNQIVFEFLNK
jgi:3-oxoadipate enol-lactonase